MLLGFDDHLTSPPSEQGREGAGDTVLLLHVEQADAASHIVGWHNVQGLLCHIQGCDEVCGGAHQETSDPGLA